MNNFQAAIDIARENIRVTERNLVITAQRLHNNYVDECVSALTKCKELRKYCNWLRRRAQKNKNLHYYCSINIIQNLDKMLPYIRTMEGICDRVGENLNAFSTLFCFTPDGAISRSEDAFRLISITEHDFREFARLHENVKEIKKITDVLFALISEHPVDFAMSDPTV